MRFICYHCQQDLNFSLLAPQYFIVHSLHLTRWCHSYSTSTWTRQTTLNSLPEGEGWATLTLFIKWRRLQSLGDRILFCLRCYQESLSRNAVNFFSLMPQDQFKPLEFSQEAIWPPTDTACLAGKRLVLLAPSSFPSRMATLWQFLCLPLVRGKLISIRCWLIPQMTLNPSL